MTKEPNRNSLIIWQEAGDDIALPALLIDQYSDCIEIHQVDGSISLNYESLPELIKALRKMINDRPAI